MEQIQASQGRVFFFQCFCFCVFVLFFCFLFFVFFEFGMFFLFFSLVSFLLGFVVGFSGLSFFKYHIIFLSLGHKEQVKKYS